MTQPTVFWRIYIVDIGYTGIPFKISLTASMAYLIKAILTDPLAFSRTDAS